MYTNTEKETTRKMLCPTCRGGVAIIQRGKRAYCWKCNDNIWVILTKWDYKK